ncbi:MAG TPA: hypothetical protein DEP35_00950, partial [Deltaproteobacteria bacterium]|nr:hypothetical protein [Deltaproteobacteria bacterium]
MGGGGLGRTRGPFAGGSRRAHHTHHRARAETPRSRRASNLRAGAGGQGARAMTDLALEPVKRLREEVGRVVVGQRGLVDGLLVALLCGGHVLVEGVPGVAKTTAVRTLAHALGLGFRRIQFTPDLLPADLLGTPIYVPGRERFEVRRGPIFTPVLLADEINR